MHDRTSKTAFVRSLKIVLLEDSEIDAELIESHLERGQFSFDMVRVATREEFCSALADAPDVVLADYSLPGFDGLTALSLMREHAPYVPFIFVSGVVGEEFATGALQHGAVDYVTKRNLRRLPTAVARAVAETREREERRRAESALRASEISSRLAMTAARLGSWDHDLRTGRLAWDSRCRELFGLDPAAQSSYEDFLSRLHPEDRDRADRAVGAAAGAEGEPFEEQFRIVLPNGQIRWVESRGQVVAEGGVAMRVVGVIRDITSEKQAQKAMLERTASLEASVEERTRERDQIWRHSHDLLAVGDFEGVLRSVSPAWTHTLGHKEADLLGRPLVDFIHPDDLHKLQMVSDAVRSDRTPQRFECRLSRIDGTYRWISWTVVPADDNLYAVGRDVTEEIAAARHLAEANAKLREQVEERERAEDALRQMQRLEAIGQLTSGVAHDFNNLLTVILGNIGFLERTLDREEIEPKARKRLGYMRAAAERGAALTDQLLSFSRRQRLEPRAVDLNDTVGSMRELLQTTMGGSIVISTEPGEYLWPALVDPTQIELIILNLAINARDAMSVGGQLTISTSNLSLGELEAGGIDLPPGDYIRLSVSDTGTGMTEEVLAKAMEPFFTTKEVGKGSGLGLPQVYGFAKQSGGTVKIETELGSGTTVSVYLPRAVGVSVAKAAAGPAAGTARRSRGGRILLVDDDEAVRDVTSSMLRDQGYQVVEAGSGGEALAALNDPDGFDVLVADYAMPGMNGGELVRAARQRHPNLPVVFLTGYADLADLESFPGDHVVRKPYKPHQLFAELESVLPSHH